MFVFVCVCLCLCVCVCLCGLVVNKFIIKTNHVYQYICTFSCTGNFSVSYVYMHAIIYIHSKSDSLIRYEWTTNFTPNTTLSTAIVLS